MRSLRLSLPALLLCLAPLAAFAQNRVFTNQYSFGDSLSDSGNLFAATSALGAPNPRPPYFQGRFSNGPVFTELLGNNLALATTAPANVRSSLNFAFGGATAGGFSQLPPSLPVQVGLFQARGIVPAKTDLFTVLFGANDLIPALSAPTTPGNPASLDVAGAAAATTVASGVQSLVALGARNVLVVGLPNLGSTPRTLASGATATAFGLRASTAFNDELKARLRPLASATADLNLTYIDLQSIVDRVVLDYKQLGFANASSFFLAPAAAGGGVGDPNSYVFWDDIHPSAKTHAILAGIVLETLNPEPVLGTAATQGSAALALASLAQSALDRRLAELGVVAPRAAGRADLYASFTYGDGNRASAGWHRKFAYTAHVVTAGTDYVLGDGFVIGAAVDHGRLNATLAAGAGRFHTDAQVGRIYGLWQSGPVSLLLDANYGGIAVNDIRRTTAFAGFTTNGKASGSAWGAGFKAAWATQVNGFTLRPWLGLRAQRVALDAYTERDIPGVLMAFDAQAAKSSTGSVGVDFGTSTRVAERSLRLDFRAAWHGELADKVRAVSGRLADNFTRTTTINLKDGDGSGYELGAAATLAFSKKWSTSLGYTGDLRADDKLANRLFLSVQTGF